MLRLLTVAVCALVPLSLLAGCGASPSSPDASQELPDASAADAGQPLPLPQGITSLAGLDPALPTADLQPLKAMIGGASLVGLGESVHTSGGYHDAKGRLIRFLVEEMGFRVLLLETPRMDAQKITDYIRTCQGTADGVMSGMFGVFTSGSMRDTLKWICDYNGKHPSDPVSFYGFDMQEPWNQGKLLRDFLQATAPSDAASLTAGLATCDGFNSASGQAYYADYKNGQPNHPPSDNSHGSCRTGAQALSDYFAGHQTALVAASSQERFALAQLALSGLSAWEDEAFYMYGPSPDYLASSLARDNEMAHSIEGLRQLLFPAAKAIVWAHNAHLWMDGEKTRGYYTDKNMGAFLREHLAADYFPIGLIGYQVDINWPMENGQPACQTMALPTGKKDAELMLHNLNRPYLLANLVPGASAFFDPATYYNFDLDGSSAKLGEQFRALLFLDHSPAMDALYWAACP